MPLFVVRSFERWRAQCAIHGHTPATDVPSVQPAATLGDAVASQVIAWYAFRAPVAATLPQGAATDIPFVTVTDTAPTWVATRQWAKWQSQPAYGWTAPSEQDTALSLPAPPWVATQQWVKWTAQPAYGWTAPSDQDVALTLPAPPWVVTRPWARWQPQPQAGWTAAPPVPAEAQPEQPPAWTPTRQWARWVPQPQYGWNRGPDATPIPATLGDAVSSQVIAWYAFRAPVAAVLQQGASTDVPAAPSLEGTPVSAVARPYLFRGYRPQPQIGWAAATDEPTLGESTPTWAISYAVRWNPQPALGWNPALDVVGAAPQVAQPPAWTAIKQWAKWQSQPAYGWTAPSEQDTASNVPGPVWTPGKPWPKWLAQPALGWAQAGDVPPVAFADTPTPYPLHPFLFGGFRLQARLGWMPALDIPAPTPPPTAGRHVLPYIRRKEQAGQRGWA